MAALDGRSPPVSARGRQPEQGKRKSRGEHRIVAQKHYEQEQKPADDWVEEQKPKLSPYLDPEVFPEHRDLFQVMQACQTQHPEVAADMIVVHLRRLVELEKLELDKRRQQILATIPDNVRRMKLKDFIGGDTSDKSLASWKAFAAFAAGAVQDEVQPPAAAVEEPVEELSIPAAAPGGDDRGPAAWTMLSIKEAREKLSRGGVRIPKMSPGEFAALSPAQRDAYLTQLQTYQKILFVEHRHQVLVELGRR
eukprot:CAMPEP_0204374534 /NCGR_PEP_ID=MMETSP0469-20131031/48696_1 /ASSEMBLY_ACC=CAM_ASM_000384 /TAXON_ID=2969 /ORGANISM="Oxyrrhis marina" /LENGTH=250 /DNA_ID=CAMNT_0051365119 /DNA_START=18 /DNA_END=770 /DNA_ORIENTATION=+